MVDTGGDSSTKQGFSPKPNRKIQKNLRIIGYSGAHIQSPLRYLPPPGRRRLSRGAEPSRPVPVHRGVCVSSDVIRSEPESVDNCAPSRHALGQARTGMCCVLWCVHVHDGIRYTLVTPPAECRISGTSEVRCIFKHQYQQ